MSSEEERFRNLSSRVGVKVSRATVSNAFRQDAALAQVLPWIVENVGDECVIDAQLQRDYKHFEGRLSLPLDQTTEHEEHPEHFSYCNVEDELDLDQIEAELQSYLSKRQQDGAMLEGLRVILEEQEQETEEKLKYAYEEEDVFVTALARESKHRALQSCDQLERQFNSFGSSFKEFMALVQQHGAEFYFTQSNTELYWNRAEEHTRQLERVMGEMGNHMLPRNGGSRLQQLVSRSALDRSPWWQELERIRQCKQVSDLNRMGVILMKTKSDIKLERIQEIASEFSHNPGQDVHACLSEWHLVWNLDVLAGFTGGGMTIAEAKEENKRTIRKYKKPLVEKLQLLLSQINRGVGADLILNCIPTLSAEWNDVSVMKHEFMQYFTRQVNRHRVFTILATIERQKLEDTIHYITYLRQTFRSTAQMCRRRIQSYSPEPLQSIDFIRQDDVYLHQLASFIKACTEMLEESEILTQIESSTASEATAKRQHSTAFSESPGSRSESRLSPISKLIKEQKQQEMHARLQSSIAEHRTTPAELETSLRRLSVEGEPCSRNTALFKDSPMHKTSLSAIPFHEFTIQANRLMALPAAAHISVTKLLSESLLRYAMTSAEALNEVHSRMFRLGDSQQLVVSVPTLKSALDGIEHLIREMNAIGSKIKGEFQSVQTYLERHPKEAQARRYLEQFFKN